MKVFILLVVSIVVARDFSISGFSSGAFMTAQMHFAYSKEVIAAGVVAGGPYYCNLGSGENLLYCTVDPDKIDLKQILAYIQSQDEAGTIDPTSNLKDSPVYIFSGLRDTVVVPDVVKLGYEVYKNYVDQDKIVTKFDIDAAHTWPTDGIGGPCEQDGIMDCKYDAAEQFLSLAYGELNPKVKMVESHIQKFYQGDYVDSLTEAGMGKYGFAYVPKSCQEDTSSCRIHISLHGCSNNYDMVGDLFVKNTGVNEWAESNNIVVIYPQTARNGPSENEEGGCWDFWGYTGSDYALKSGKQMKAIYSMVQDPPKYEEEDDDDSQATLLICIWLVALITI
jgi:poly(3-hydroxybutyrate) depolymerase